MIIPLRNKIFVTVAVVTSIFALITPTSTLTTQLKSPFPDNNSDQILKKARIQLATAAQALGKESFAADPFTPHSISSNEESITVLSENLNLSTGENSSNVNLNLDAFRNRTNTTLSDVMIERLLGLQFIRLATNKVFRRSTNQESKNQSPWQRILQNPIYHLFLWLTLFLFLSLGTNFIPIFSSDSTEGHNGTKVSWWFRRTQHRISNNLLNIDYLKDLIFNLFNIDYLKEKCSKDGYDLLRVELSLILLLGITSTFHPAAICSEINIFVTTFGLLVLFITFLLIFCYLGCNENNISVKNRTLKFTKSDNYRIQPFHPKDFHGLTKMRFGIPDHLIQELDLSKEILEDLKQISANEQPIIKYFFQKPKKAMKSYAMKSQRILRATKRKNTK